MLPKIVYNTVKPHNKKEESKKNNHKAMKLTAISLAGVGVGIGASIIYRNRKLKQQAEHKYYMDRLEEYISEQEEYERQESIKKKIKDDLECKVDEFNSRRLNYENENHSSKEELERYTESAEDINDI